MSDKELSVRDQMRAAIFDSKNKKPATKELELFGQKVEIRQPTLAQISKMSSTKPEDKIPGIVKIMIEYCYVPGTNDKVFEKGDAETLSQLPTGKWLSDFNDAMEELSGVNVKEAEKNSEETD